MSVPPKLGGSRNASIKNQQAAMATQKIMNARVFRADSNIGGVASWALGMSAAAARLDVQFQVLGGGGRPGEARSLRQSSLHQILARLEVTQLFEGRDEQFRGGIVQQQRSLTGDLRYARSPESDHRTTAGHGLDHRQ